MMKQTLLILGASALAFAATPALAKPGKDKGHGNHNAHAEMDHSKHGKGKMYAYGKGKCPPGLAKKNAMCMPPGQMKKLYATGQRFRPTTAMPGTTTRSRYDLRTQYGFQPNANYYYGNGYLYQVDPRTRLIQSVVNAIMR